jgi:hypothetical protein
MKNTFKILGIIAFIAVIGFSMTACPNDAGYSGTKQFITVTDIPSTYINKYGILMLSPPNNPSDIVAYSSMEKISGASFTFPLYNWKNGDPWEGSGSYIIKILIFENRTDTQWKYAGVTLEINITETTTIPWSLFIDKTT